MKFFVFFAFLALVVAQKAYVRPKFNNIINVCPSKRTGCHFWNHAGDSMGLVNAIKATQIPSEFHVYYGDGETYYATEITKMVNIVGKCGYGPISKVAEKISLKKKKGHTGTAGTHTRTTRGSPICKPFILANNGVFFTLVSNATYDASGSCFSNLMLLNGGAMNGVPGFFVPASTEVVPRSVNNIQIMNVEFFEFVVAIKINGNANFWHIIENTFALQLISVEAAAIFVLEGIRFSGNVISKNIIELVNPLQGTTQNGMGIQVKTDNAANNEITLNILRCVGCNQNQQTDALTQVGIFYGGFSSVISQNTIDGFGIGARFESSAANNFFEWNNVTASTNHGIFLAEGGTYRGANNILYNVIERTINTAGLTIQAQHTAVVQTNDFTLNEVIDIQNLSPSTVLSNNALDVCVGFCF